jgi:hypothetical protein
MCFALNCHLKAILKTKGTFNQARESKLPTASNRKPIQIGKDTVIQVAPGALSTRMAAP